MDDREFLGYFSRLGSKDVQRVKQASNDIVSTLLALDSKIGRKASADSSASKDKDLDKKQSKIKQKAENSIKQKHSQGDLGEKMSADLNYALKRLVRGLYSDNHAVKQGFFLASVMVLNRFQAQIDFEKYVKFVNEETKTNAGMKNPEVHAVLMGRMMCVSAIIESGWVSQASSQSSQTQLMALIDILAEIHSSQEFLREAIQVVLVKVLKQLTKSVKIFDHAVKKLLMASQTEDKKEKQLHDKILSSSSELSLFLALRDAYLEHFAGQSKEYEEIMNFNILGNKKSLQQISTLVKSQTYLHPRLHSSVHLVIKELFRERKQVEKNFDLFNRTVLEGCIFNEAVYDSMKSVPKLKYLHVGLKIVETILKQVQEMSSSKNTALKQKIVETLLLGSPNFRSVLIRNVQMPKNQLHEAALEVKMQLAAILEQFKDSPSDQQRLLSYKLLTGLFGPNSFTHFSAKKNQDLMRPLCAELDEDQISEYIDTYLKGALTKPDLKEFYPDEAPEQATKGRASNADETVQSGTFQKRLAIQQFALLQASSLPAIFKESGTLKSRHILLTLNLLVKAAYLSPNGSTSQELQSSAQFKLFGLVNQLQKTSLAGSSLRKGFCKDGELWCMRVNKLVNKAVDEQSANGDQGDQQEEEQLDSASLCKIHKKNTKYAQKHIAQARCDIQAAVNDLDEVKDNELVLKHKEQLRKLVAFETLFLNLCLLILIPQAGGDQKTVIETLEDIEELKECFQNLGLDKIQTKSKKARKMDEDEVATGQEARTVLIDFLTSLLAKPQSFLREVANLCFKHFCVDCVDDQNIARLLAIVGTPDKEAGEFMDGAQDAGAEEEEPEDFEEENEPDEDSSEDSDE